MGELLPLLEEGDFLLDIVKKNFYILTNRIILGTIVIQILQLEG